MKQRACQLLRRSAILGAGAYVAYLVLMNAFLRSPLALPLFNVAPQRVQLSFAKAWTWWPLSLHATDIDLSYQDDLVQLRVVAAEGGLVLKPWFLLVRRFTASSVKG